MQQERTEWGKIRLSKGFQSAGFVSEARVWGSSNFPKRPVQELDARWMGESIEIQAD